MGQMLVETGKTAVLTAPMSLQWRVEGEHRSFNLLQLIRNVFGSVRPGSDLTRFQLPPQFSMPKSQLQCIGETVYSVTGNYLAQCSEGKNSLERMTAVVAWSVSTIRPHIFAAAPYSPVLGETHHVSRGPLNVLLEQVSHHPPVSALHATDSQANIELVLCQNPLPRFIGTGVEVALRGYKRLNLLSHGESYELTAPALVMKLLPVPGTKWTGTVRVRCPESGLRADVRYHRNNSVLGLGGCSCAVSGKIFREDTNETLREINGRWDGQVTVKDLATGDVSLIYDGKEALSNLQTPVLMNAEGLMETESAAVWGEVSAALLRADWDGARAAKRKVEEEERRQRAEREKSGKVWKPRFFRVTKSADGGWECVPLASKVPPAPIVAH